MVIAKFKNLVTSATGRNIFATSIALGSNTIAQIFIARILGPDLFGVTSMVIGLVLSYSIFMQGGVLNALSQRYPYLIGKGDQNSETIAKEMLSNSCGYIILASSIVFIVVLLIAFREFSKGNELLFFGFLAASIIAPLNLIKVYFYFVMRVRNQFIEFSYITISAGIFPIIWAAMAYLFGLKGQWAAIAITESMLVCYLFLVIGKEIKIKFTIRKIIEYMQYGATIFLTASIYEFILTLDRLLIAIRLSSKELGFYAVAGMFGVFMQVIPKTINQVSWTTIATIRGGESPAEKNKVILSLISKNFDKLSNIYYLSAPIIVIIPIFIHIVFPKYVEIIDISKLLLLSSFFIGAGEIYLSYLGTEKKLNLVMAALIILGTILYIFLRYLVGIENYLIIVTTSKITFFIVLFIGLKIYGESVLGRKLTSSIKDIFINLLCYLLLCCCLFFILPMIINIDYQNIINQKLNILYSIISAWIFASIIFLIKFLLRAVIK